MSLSRSSSLRQNENQSSTDSNLSDKHRNILKSLINEFNNTLRISPNRKENKQKAEAINSAIQVIDKMEKSEQEYLVNIEKMEKSEQEYLVNIEKMEKSEQEYLVNIEKKNEKIKDLEQKIEEINKEFAESKTKMEKSNQEYSVNKEKNNNTIKELEAKNEKINKKHNDLKNKMEKSNQEYTSKINKKNEEIQTLERKHLEMNKELTEFRTKQSTTANTCSGGKQTIYMNTDVKKDSQFPEKDEEIKQLKAKTNELQADKDLLMNKNKALQDKYDGLDAVNTVLNIELSENRDVIHKLEAEINQLQADNEIQTNTPVIESRR